MERIKNISLGPRYAIRLEDFGTWDRLQAVCLVCRHRALLNPAELLERWSRHTRIVEIAKRVRCSACGNRTGNSLSPGRVARD